MKIADLPMEVIERIKARRYDRIVEKHEGPFRWESIFDQEGPEFLQVQGFNVLLPVERANHPNITVLRVIVADDRSALTIFLKDSTFVKERENEWFMAGFRSAV